VPVFARSGDTARPGYNDREFYASIPVSLPAHPSPGDHQVIVRPSPRGGTEFLFLANRHLGNSQNRDSRLLRLDCDHSVFLLGKRFSFTFNIHVWRPTVALLGIVGVVQHVITDV